MDLIESKKTSTKCPSCLQHVFEGTTTCTCGKIATTQENVMDRIKSAFGALKALYYRTSPTITRGSQCGPNPWHHNAREALRSATKGDRKYTSIWDRWRNDEAYRTSQLAHNWTDAWVRYLDFIVHIGISHNAPSWQRERYINLVHLRDLDLEQASGTIMGATWVQGSKKSPRKCSKKHKDKEFPTFHWILELVRTTNLILQHKNIWNG